MNVAQHPAGVRRPGEHPERCRVRHKNHVGSALERRNVKAAARRINWKHRAARQILQQQCRCRIDAGAQDTQGFLTHQGLAAQHAVDVREGKTNHFDATFVRGCRQVLRRRILFR